MTLSWEGKADTSDDLILSQRDLDSLHDGVPGTELCPSVLGASAVLSDNPNNGNRNYLPPAVQT